MLDYVIALNIIVVIICLLCSLFGDEPFGDEPLMFFYMIIFFSSMIWSISGLFWFLPQLMIKYLL